MDDMTPIQYLLLFGVMISALVAVLYQMTYGIPYYDEDDFDYYLDEEIECYDESADCESVRSWRQM